MKNVLIIGVLFCWAGIANAFGESQTDQNTNPVSIQTKNDESQLNVFGFALGRDTSDDVSRKAGVKVDVCGSYGIGSLSKFGKSLFIPEELRDCKRIGFAEFNVGTDYFEAVFLNDILIELKIRKSQYESYFDSSDKKFISDIRISFNKKYSKLKTIRIGNKGSIQSWTYTFESWEAPAKAFTAILEDRRKVTLSESACFATIAGISGRGTAELEYDCKTVTNNLPKYYLSYQHEEEYFKAYSLINDFIINKNAEIEKQKSKKMKKY